MKQYALRSIFAFTILVTAIATFQNCRGSQPTPGQGTFGSPSSPLNDSAKDVRLVSAPAENDFSVNQIRRINTWAVLGPFNPSQNSGLHTDFLSGQEGQPHRLGAEISGIRWSYLDDRIYCRNQDDYVDLFTYFMRQDPAGGVHPAAPWANGRVAYASTYVFVPRTGHQDRMEVRVFFSANDQAKLWINGSVIHSDSEPRQSDKNFEIPGPVYLHAGRWNHIQIKIANQYRIWGFYFGLSTPTGNAIPSLQISPDDPTPEKPLRILTDALPEGFRDQSYVLLSRPPARNIAPANNPEASPFKFSAAGGEPPYRWTLEGLPAGLSYSADLGEITGVTGHTGSHSVRVHLMDSKGRHAEKTFALAIRPRVTEPWYEKRRLGGLQHETLRGRVDNLDEYARTLSQQGYQWLAPTEHSNVHFQSWTQEASDVSYHAQEASRLKKALDPYGVRLGIYFNFGDLLKMDSPGASGWSRHADFQTAKKYVEANHLALQSLIQHLNPELWWLDAFSANDSRLSGKSIPWLELQRNPTLSALNWEIDALYSLIKTLSPNAVVIQNVGDPRFLASEYGDMDVIAGESVNEAGKKKAYHWSHLPLLQQIGRPAKTSDPAKFRPVELWRYINDQDPDSLNWESWVKSLVFHSVHLGKRFVYNLDHTFHASGRSARTHAWIREWMQSRQDWVFAPLREPQSLQHGLFAVREDTGSGVFFAFREKLMESDFPLDLSQRGNHALHPVGLQYRGILADQTVRLENLPFAVERVLLQPQGRELFFRRLNAAGTDISVSVHDLGRLDEVVTILELRRSSSLSLNINGIAGGTDPREPALIPLAEGEARTYTWSCEGSCSGHSARYLNSKECDLTNAEVRAIPWMTEPNGRRVSDFSDAILNQCQAVVREVSDHGRNFERAFYFRFVPRGLLEPRAPDAPSLGLVINGIGGSSDPRFPAEIPYSTTRTWQWSCQGDCGAAEARFLNSEECRPLGDLGHDSDVPWMRSARGVKQDPAPSSGVLGKCQSYRRVITDSHGKRFAQDFYFRYKP